MLAIKQIITIILLPLLFGISSLLSADDRIRFFLEDDLVYASQSKSSPGFLLEIVLEMSRIMEIEPQVEFLPWKRAQIMAISTPNSIIFPLTRTESREPNYRWISKVLDVPVMFITKQGQPLINTIEQAKLLKKIAVIFGTPQEKQLKKWGLFNYAIMPGARLYKVLMEGGVDAIYGARPEAVISWKRVATKKNCSLVKHYRLFRCG